MKLRVINAIHSILGPGTLYCDDIHGNTQLCESLDVGLTSWPQI